MQRENKQLVLLTTVVMIIVDKGMLAVSIKMYLRLPCTN